MALTRWCPWESCVGWGSARRAGAARTRRISVFMLIPQLMGCQIHMIMVRAASSWSGPRRGPDNPDETGRLGGAWAVALAHGPRGQAGGTGASRATGASRGERKPAPAAARGCGRGGGQVMSRPGRAGLDAAGACHVVGGGLAGGRGRDAGSLEVRDVDVSGVGRRGGRV